MDAMRKLLVIFVLLFCATSVYADEEESLLNQEMCDSRLREVINGVTTNDALTEESAKQLMAACASGDLSKDISVQIMLMLFGEQVIYGLEFTKFVVSLLESYTGGANVNYNESEAERLASMFPAFQQVILYMNWIFVGIFVFFIVLRIHMILFRLKVT